MGSRNDDSCAKRERSLDPSFSWCSRRAVALIDAGEAHPMVEAHRLIGIGSTELLATLLGHDDPAVAASQGRYFAEASGLVDGKSTWFGDPVPLLDGRTEPRAPLRGASIPVR
jgi:hypothetical protein